MSTIAQSWLEGNSQNNGLVIQAESTESSGIFHGFHLSKPYRRAVLTFYLNNPYPPPATNTVNLGHVEAGSVISLRYEGLDGTNVTSKQKPAAVLSQAPSNQGHVTNSTGGQSAEYPFSFVNDAPCGGKEVGASLLFEDDNPDDSLAIDLQPDSTILAEGDTASFTPVLKFANGVTRPFPALQLFDLGIVEGSEYGQLWDREFNANGNFLSEVYQGFQYVATDSLPADSSSATTKIAVIAVLGNTRVDGGTPTLVPTRSTPEHDIRSNGQDKTANPTASNQNNAPIVVTGTTDLLIQRDSLALSIELPDSAQVWPTLRARDGGNDSTRSNMEEDIEVSLLRGGQAVTEHSVLLTAFRLEGSGGHEHELAEGSPDREQLGSFIFEGNTTEVELETETNAEGQIEFDYQSSIFSGKYVFKAATFIDGDSLFAMDTLTVSVPNMILLEEDTTYVLSGGTCNHHGAERPGNPIPARCESPDQIHYTTETTKDSLVAAAKEYLNAKWNTNDEKIRVNDISLPLGGLFDISGDWDGPHESHRIGEDVDIENVGNLQKVKEAFLNNGWEFIEHDGTGFFPHFRLED